MICKVLSHKATPERPRSIKYFQEEKWFWTNVKFHPVLNERYFCCIENLTPNIYWQKCNKYNCRLTLLVLVEKEITEGKKSYIEHLCFTNIAEFVNGQINTQKLTLSVVQKVTNLMSTFEGHTRTHVFVDILVVVEKLQLNYKMLKRLSTNSTSVFQLFVHYGHSGTKFLQFLLGGQGSEIRRDN